MPKTGTYSWASLSKKNERNLGERDGMFMGGRKWNSQGDRKLEKLDLECRYM